MQLTCRAGGALQCAVIPNNLRAQSPPTPRRVPTTRVVKALFKNPFDNKPATKTPQPPAKVRPTVIPEPSFNIPVVLLGFSAFCAYEGVTPVAALFGLLGVFLGVQSTRVRFVFDDEALEVKVGEQLDDSGPNAFVGGKNRWPYDSLVNWEFWWPGFPVLVYFKETQTKPEGQLHFFPVLFNGQQLYTVMLERCGPTKTSGK